MNSRDKHVLALRLHRAGNHDEALKLLGEILEQEDSAEIWNDWASVQFVKGDPAEAEAGYRLALQLDTGNAQVDANLGLLLTAQERFAEAFPLLERGLEAGDEQQRAAVARHWTYVQEELSVRPFERREALAAFLREYASGDANELSYFQTHESRFVATLQAIPQATEGQQILELGSAFHHLTAALKHCKGYREVCCTDVWDGEAKEQRTLLSKSGDRMDSFRVDNFDLQKQPWPYQDETFDGVLCCEIIEHLHSDPMGMLAEINRVLKQGGFLLLTTPNLASGHAVEQTAAGCSPYGYGKFEIGGRPTDRHNREYTASEVERLTAAAGFQMEFLRTQDFYWPAKRETLVQLAVRGHAISRRGDSTILRARKTGPVRDRYPEEFYCGVGIQASRRESQEQTAGLAAAGVPSAGDA